MATKTTVASIKSSWNKLTVPERVLWCTEAGIGGVKGSLDVNQIDIDMFEALSQTALSGLNEIGEDVMTSKTAVKHEAELELPETEAQETQVDVPEANKAKDIFGGETVKKDGKKKVKSVKENKVEPEQEPVKEKKKPVAKPPVKQSKPPMLFARQWNLATKRSRTELLTSVDCRANQANKEWSDLDKEDRQSIAKGDYAILDVTPVSKPKETPTEVKPVTHVTKNDDIKKPDNWDEMTAGQKAWYTRMARAGQATTPSGNDKVQKAKKITQKDRMIDPDAKLTDINLKNMRDMSGDGSAYLATGYGNNGLTYVVFVARKREK